MRISKEKRVFYKEKCNGNLIIKNTNIVIPKELKDEFHKKFAFLLLNEKRIKEINKFLEENKEIVEENTDISFKDWISY